MRAALLSAVLVQLLLVSLGCESSSGISAQSSVAKDELLFDLASRSPDDESVQAVLGPLCMNYSLSKDEFEAVKRFVDSPGDTVFSAAVECLSKTDSPEATAMLHTLVQSDQLFRAFRAAQVLNRLGDASGVLSVAKRLANTRDSLEARRDVIWRIFAERPRDLANDYVDMLRDAEIWMRYGAVCVLRWYSGDDFGYEYRSPSQRSIEEWERWLKANQSLLPEDFRSESRIPVGVVGVELSGHGDAPRVSRVELGTPAHEAGVKAGDELLSVDGDPAIGKTAIELSLCELRGTPGSPVRLGVRRGAATREVSMVRVQLGRLE